jgi:hypothetical protein
VRILTNGRGLRCKSEERSAVLGDGGRLWLLGSG